MGATFTKRRSSARNLRKTTIENIPEPLILDIFSYLSQKELCQIARVCKQWHRITRDNRLWSHVDITPDALNHEGMWTFLRSHFSEVLQTLKLRKEYSPADTSVIRNKVNLSSAMFKDLEGWFPNLRTLWLHNCDLYPVNAALLPSSLHTLHLDWSVIPYRWFEPIKTGSLKNLKVLKLSVCIPISRSNYEHISKLATLEVLDLSNCLMLTDEKLRVVATKLTCLTELCINGTCCTDRALHHISRNLKNLKVLDVSWTRLTDAAVGSVISNLKNLKVLQLSGCSSITMNNLEHINEVTALEVLDLSNCTSVTDDALRVVAEKLTCLKELRIKRTGCTDRALHHISRNLKNLKVLDMSWTELSVAAVGSVISNLKNLKVLKLSGCSRINMTNLEHINGVAALGVLDLTYCNSTDDALHHISRNLKNLKVLDVSHTELSDAAVGSVFSNLKNLKVLKLSGCSRITMTNLEHINEVAALEVLDLSYCISVTDDGVRVVVEKLPCLMELHIRVTSCTHLALHHISSNLKNLKVLDVNLTGCLDVILPVGSVVSSQKNLKVLRFACSHISIKYLEPISKTTALKILHIINTDDAVKVITEKLTCLTELHINGANCTDRALHHISRNLKNLKLLDMSENSRLTDAAVGSVANGLKNLIHLNISGCEALTDAAVNSVADNLKQLEVFHFCNTNTTCEPVRSFSKKMPKLRDIAMGNIDDVGLESLVQSQLVSLKVGVANLSDEGFSQLHKMTNLKNLILCNCSERAIQRFKGQRPLHKFKNLKKLTLSKHQSKGAIQIVKGQLPEVVLNMR